MAEYVHGKSCPECYHPITYGKSEKDTKIMGRVYRLKHMLNPIFRCANCGYLFSPKEDI